MSDPIHCGHADRSPVLCCTHIAHKTVGKIHWVPADAGNPKTA